MISVRGITIELDYTYDTNGFFDQPGSKEALRAVADFFEERLQDNLLEIDAVAFGNDSSWTARFASPATGIIIEITNLVVPEDTLIVYAGGRNLSSAAGRGGPGGYGAMGFQDWFDRIDARGQSGELQDPVTDFGPWGGVLAFDTERDWNFQLDGRPEGSTTDFVSIALHELGHLLGLGTSAAWDAQIDESNQFTGTRSVASFGGPVPLDANQGHWRDDASCSFPLGYDPGNPLNILSLTYESFGSDHAVDQIAIMDPSTCTISSVTSLKVFSDLDFAGLSDIGWEVFQPLRLEANSLAPSAVSVAWPSSTGQIYAIQRTVDLAADWTTVSTELAGDGAVFEFSDSAPPAGRAFYRLVDPTLLEGGNTPALRTQVVRLKKDAPSSREFRFVEGCGVHEH